MPAFSLNRAGVVIRPRKEATEHKPIEEASVPAEVILPLQQHTGAPPVVMVKVGDKVSVGQKLAEVSAFISAPVHASVDGKIKAIEKRRIVTGAAVEAVIIEASPEQGPVPLVERDVSALTKEEIVEIVREAGIVGLGGAAFPTHVKLTPPTDRSIDSVIINGCECEPFLTCDYRQMVEYPDEIIEGTRLIMRVVGAPRAYIAIEADKREAIHIIRERLSANNGSISVVAVGAIYPQGAEKQLIKHVLGREVPSRGLPAFVGALVQNVGTTISIYRACRYGRPLIDRVVTVSGSAIREPKNLRVRLGTPVSHLIAECGGLTPDVGKVVMGGPMMGVSIYDFSVPVVKGTSGLVAMARDEIESPENAACVRAVNPTVPCQLY